jgi:hypothetical protein
VIFKAAKRRSVHPKCALPGDRQNDHASEVMSDESEVAVLITDGTTPKATAAATHYSRTLISRSSPGGAK